MDVTTRDAEDRDSEWLFSLHRSAFRERIEIVYGVWDEDWQREAWGRRDPRTRVEVILAKGVEVGAIHTCTRHDGSLYIDLLEVMPEFQDQGIGFAVLAGACARADESDRDVSLRVHKGNPAQHLYERLGFEPEGTTETHVLMRRRHGEMPSARPG